MECTVKKGKVSQNNNNNNNNQNNDKKVTEKDVKKLLKRTSKAKQGDDWLHTDGSKILAVSASGTLFLTRTAKRFGSRA